MKRELLTRIVITLRWFVEDARHRFDDCKDAMDQGSTGGYSPDLTDAIELLHELEVPMLGQVNLEALVFTEQQCKDAAVMVGGTESDGEAFYIQYAPQGFCWGNGMPITDLRIAMRRWMLKGAEFDAPASNESTAERLARIEQEKRV